MVAVLAIVAHHLWGVPRGGFVGIDVFFVISGFLVTGGLLRSAEGRESPSMRQFYWNRLRRIVPAATVVLLLTCVAAALVFPAARAHQVGLDAAFSFVFLANWRFAAENAGGIASAQSPLQHYWALSVEEQFHLLWPLVVLALCLVAARRAWPHARRTMLIGGVVGVLIAASWGWSLYETATSADWAYFDTAARLWELGIGALLATAAGVLARIPEVLKPALSWAGLVLIGAGMVLIDAGSTGFPAPWALLPVTGAALVIGAGVGSEPVLQGLLRNPVSTYLGDISYSLYLVHWPVIVIVGATMAPGAHFAACVLALSFGLAVACHHFVENPLRDASPERFRELRHDIRRGLYHPLPSSKYAAVAALTLVTVALIAFVTRPDAYDQGTPPPVPVVTPHQGV